MSICPADGAWTVTASTVSGLPVVLVSLEPNAGLTFA